jgi:hypothetical protein
MQDHLGFQCASILHDVLYAKKMDVCSDPHHPCHESLCIATFIYMFEHSSRDKSYKFNGKFYLQPTHLNEDIIVWLKQTRLFGYPRPPIILEVLNRYFVTFIRPDEANGTLENVAIECKDMIHCILTWIYCLHTYYKSILRVELAVDCSKWYAEFYNEKAKPISFEDMLKNQK